MDNLYRINWVKKEYANVTVVAKSEKEAKEKAKQEADERKLYRKLKKKYDKKEKENS